MTQLACLNPRCAIPRRHRDDCAGDQCRGCLPGWAADGLRLCAVCCRRLGENAVKAAELHGELELMLRPNGTGGQATGKPGSASPPRDAVVAMRTEIRHYLAWWAKLISNERGLSLPADEVTAIGAYVARHAEWLAAHKLAGYAADELATLASRAWGMAYPDGAHRIRVGPCPRCGGVQDGRWVVQRLPAGFIGPPNRAGQLVAIVRDADQDKLPAEVFCDTVAEHEWPAPQWRHLDRLVMKTRRALAPPPVPDQPPVRSLPRAVQWFRGVSCEHPAPIQVGTFGRPHLVLCDGCGTQWCPGRLVMARKRAAA